MARRTQPPLTPGIKFGRLTTVRPIMGAHVRWLCACLCGDEKTVRAEALRNGATKSCGCLSREVVQARLTTHGEAPAGNQSREYRTWASIKGRCFNENDTSFKNYGARGITVCDEWKNSFERFLSDMGRCPPRLTIGRIDNDGDYCMENCRWESVAQQAVNTRWNVFVEADGKTMALSEFARSRDLNYKSLHHFYRMRGVPLEEAARRASRGFTSLTHPRR